MTGRPAASMRVREREFQDSVLELARLFRWRVAHFRPAQTSSGWRTAMIGDPGYPDVTAVRDGRLIFAELKTADGRVSAEQYDWLQALASTAAETYCWRPSDWDEITQVLR